MGDGARQVRHQPSVLLHQLLAQGHLPVVRHEHHLRRHLAGGDLSVARVRAVQRRGGEGVHGADRVDPPLLPPVVVQEGHVAVHRPEHHVDRRIRRVGDVFFPHLRILRVVDAPEEPLGIAREVLLPAPPQLGLFGAEEQDRRLVVLRVADEPVVRVEAVVVLGEDLDDVVDAGSVLGGLADAGGLRRAVDVERGLHDRRLPDHDAGVVEVEVRPRVDPSREGLVHEPVPRAGDHIADHVPVDAGVTVPHEQLSEHDPAVRGRRAVRQKGGALVQPLRGVGLFLVGAEAPPRQDARRLGQRAAELPEVHGGVHGDHVEVVQRPAAHLGSRFGGTVGDPAHLDEILLVVFPEHQGVGQCPQLVPAAPRIVAVLPDGQLLDVRGQLLREQGAVLVAALIGIAFDMHEDPSAVGVPERRAEPAHRRGRDDLRDVLHLFQPDVIEPGRAGGLAVEPQVEPHPVLCRRREEEHLQLLPLAGRPGGRGRVGEWE